MIVEDLLAPIDVEQLKNPFPGLRSFDRDEYELFFGRDGQSAQLLVKLTKTHFLAVVGTSGSGKSSLVRAGLLPALGLGSTGKSGSGWRIAIMRPGNDPIANLARALNEPGALEMHYHENREIQTQRTLSRNSRGLIETVRRARLEPHENLLVVVDQFEELFRFARISEDEEYADNAAAFVKRLLEASHEENIYIVLTMRSDYLGDCAKFADLPEAINESQYLIPRMTKEERCEAIVNPLTVRGARITPGLVNQLLSDIGQSPDQLPVLQHALMRIWDKWREDDDPNSPLGTGHYERTGGLAGTLSRHANEAYDELPDDWRRKIAEKLFRCLTEKGLDDKETRRPTELNEVCLVTGASKTEVIEVMDIFRREGRSFLMPSQNVPLKGDTSIDISHESLISGWQRLKDWVDEEADSARVYRRLVEYARSSRRFKKGELRDPWLQETLDWRDKNQPNRAWARRHHKRFYDTPHPSKKAKKTQDKEIFNLAMAFLNESELARDNAKKAEERAREEKEERRRKEVRRARQFAAVLAVGVVVIAVFLGWALSVLRQRDRAIEQTQKMNLLNYRTTMNLAQQALNDGKWGQTNHFLSSLPIPGVDDLRGLDWYYLWRLSHDERETLRGHSAEISSVAFSPDGQTMATGSEDETVKLWQLSNTQDSVRELKGHTGPIFSVAFSSNGNVLATSSADGTVKLWNRETGKELPNSLPSAGNSAFIRSLAFAPKRSTLVTGSNDGRNTLAMGSNDGRVLIWSITEQSASESQVKHSGYVSSVAFSPDGTTIVSGSGDGWVKLCDAITKEETGSFSSGEEVLAVAISPDGKTVAAATGKGHIMLWDKEQGQSKPFSTLRMPAAALSMTFVNAQTLITGNDDGTVRKWDIKSGEELRTFKGHSKRVSAIAISSDGKNVVTGSADKTAKLWDVSESPTTTKLTGHSKPVLCVAFSPKAESKFFASGSEDGTINLWDSNGTQPVLTLRGQPATPILAVAISPDGQTLASGGADARVLLWNVSTGQLFAILPGHAREVSSVAFSPDGKTLATGSADTTVKLWDMNTLTETRPPLKGHSRTVKSLTFSVDGTTLASGSEDETIRLWDTATGEEKTALRGRFSVLSVAFSRDGKLLASGGADRTATLWDAKTGEPLTTIGHNETVVSVAFSPAESNQRLVTAGNDGSVKFWDTSASSEEPIRRDELATLRTRRAANSAPKGWWRKESGEPPMTQLPNRLLSLAISRNGEMIVTGREDGSLELWQAATFNKRTSNSAP